MSGNSSIFTLIIRRGCSHISLRMCQEIALLYTFTVKMCQDCTVVLLFTQIKVFGYNNSIINDVSWNNKLFSKIMCWGTLRTILKIANLVKNSCVVRKGLFSAHLSEYSQLNELSFVAYSRDTVPSIFARLYSNMFY